MKWIFCGLLCLLSACQSIPPQVQPLVSADGQRVGFKSMPAAGGVAVVIDWPNSGAMQKYSNPAVSRLGADILLAGGSAQFSAAELRRKWQAWGGRARLLPRGDSLRAVVQIDSEYLLPAMASINHILLAPHFDRRLQDERAKKMQSEQAQANQNPRVIARQVMGYLMMPDDRQRQRYLIDDPYLYLEVAILDLQQWHRDLFQGRSLRVAVAGDVTAKHARLAVDRLLKGLPDFSVASFSAQPIDVRPQQVLVHRPNAERTHLALYAPLPNLTDSGFADVLAVMVLGQGEGARLNAAVAEQQLIQQGIVATLSSFGQDARFIVVEANGDNKQLMELKTVLIEAYRQFYESGPSEEEVKAKKKLLLAQFKGNLRESPAVIAASLMDFERLGWRDDGLERAQRELESLDAAALKRHVKMHWPTVEQFSSVVISAHKDALIGGCVISKPAVAVACR